MADKTVVVRIVVRANQFSSGLKKAASDTEGFAVDVQRSTEKAGSSALALGTASATAGKLMLVGIGGAMAVSAKAAIDFESSLAGVAKTTDLAGSAFARNGSPLASFGEALRSLSMRIPLNVNELARIAEVGGQLGIETPNLIEFTEVMAALGVSTNLTAEEAATSLARFVKVMGTAQDQFGRLGSVVVDLGNNLPTTESEILTFAQRLAPVARTVGLTEEEVLGLSAAMTSLGIPAERGGTALQRLFIDMDTAVKSGGESLEKFARATNTTAEEFQALFRRSPAEAFVKLVRSLDQTTAAGGSAAGVLQDLGVIQQRSIQVLLASASGWETVADSISTANEAGEDGNALFEEAARRYGTSASQIQILSNAFTDLRIEVGNALLGSGGLAAGLDFLREFIRIIKDNLPMVGRLAATLATVAALRLGANIFSGLKEGFDKLRAMAGAAQGLSRGAAAAQLGMLGLNTAVFGAITIAGILITKWAMAAVKAAELRRQARLLQEQINEGQDPIQAMVGLLEEEGVLTSRVTEALADLGISQEEFVRRLMSSADIVQEFGDTGKTASEKYAAMAEILGVTTSELVDMGLAYLEGKEEGLAYNDMLDAVAKGTEITGAFLKNRADDFRNAFIEAGLGVRFTAEELKKIAEFSAINNPFDTDPAAVARRIADFGGFPEMSIAAEQMAASMEGSTRRTSRSWRAMVLDMEGGSDLIEDFFDSIEGSAEEYRTTIEETFAEVRDTVMGSFPVWDEYEQVQLENINAVIKAQDAYLQDLEDGLALQNDLVGEVSSAVLGYIEGLDPATKGALARWRSTNRTEFDNWIAEVSDNLDEADILTRDYFLLKLPGAMREGMNQLFLDTVTEAQKFNVPGKQTADAIFEGLQAQMAFLSTQEQDVLLDQILRAFNNPEFLFSIGLKIGDPVVAGFIASMGRLSEGAMSTLNRESAQVRKLFESEFEIESPSKMTMRIGEQVTKGLFVGMEEEFSRQMRTTQVPIVNVANKAPIVNVHTTSSAGSRDLHIYYPQHKGDDIVDGVSKASFLNGIVREAETTVGFN